MKPRNIPKDYLPVLLGELGSARLFGPGEVICKEGATDGSLFVIRSGEIEIRKNVDRDKGSYKVIAILEGGDFFGEMAAFLDEPRSADAVAKSAGEIIEVKKYDFSRLLSSEPAKAFKALEALTTVLMERLRVTTSELATVYETGKLVSSSRGIAELSEHVMDKVLSAVGAAERGLFVIWNEFNQEFEIIRTAGFGPEAQTSIPSDDPLISWLASSKEAFLSHDFRRERRFEPKQDTIYEGQSILASPFFSRERMLGFIVLLNRSMKAAFSSDHAVLLSAICGYVSVALENLRYLQQETDRSRLSQARSSLSY